MRGQGLVRGLGLALVLVLGVEGSLVTGCRTTDEGLEGGEEPAGGMTGAGPAAPVPAIEAPPAAMAPPPASVPPPASTPPPASVPPPASTPPPAGCAVGQVHCAGKVPQICAADGTWLTGAPCAYACQEGCVNRFAAVSSGRGSPTDGEGVVEFTRNNETIFSQRGGLLGARGFNVAVMDPATGQDLEPVKNFNPWTTPFSGSAHSNLADYLEAIEPGRLVMVAVCDDAGLTTINSCDKLTSAPVKRVLDVLGRLGSRQIASYCYRGSWSFMAVTGRPVALAEKLGSGAKVTAEVMLPAAP